MPPRPVLHPGLSSLEEYNTLGSVSNCGIWVPASALHETSRSVLIIVCRYCQKETNRNLLCFYHEEHTSFGQFQCHVFKGAYSVRMIMISKRWTLGSRQLDCLSFTANIIR